jgi:TATA-box binding protein (TBP) (component of TFIID and TFIIIB)
MKTIDIIRNRLIDKIMVRDNEQLLIAIENIFNSTQNEDELNLDSDQIELLFMSENDIKLGNMVSEADLKKADSKWME